jgi:acetylornithine/succinyldiaminopimelate/putrescine aminotransferase
MLNIQSDQKFLEHVKDMSNIFRIGLEEIKGEFPDLLKEIRGRGLMWGVEFHNESDSQIAMLSIIKEGVLLDYCNNKKDTLKILPPLVVQKHELEVILSKIRVALKKIKNIKK